MARYWKSVYTGIFTFAGKVKTTYNEMCGFIKCELNKYSYNLLVNAFTCNVNEFLFLKNNDVHLTDPLTLPLARQRVNIFPCFNNLPRLRCASVRISMLKQMRTHTCTRLA